MKKGIFWVMLGVMVLSAYACIQDLVFKLPYKGYAPLDIGDGWMLSTPSAEGLDPTKIDEVYRMVFSESSYVNAVSLVIIRNGKLIAEGYCRDENDRILVNSLQSATKSFTSLLTGIALDLGILDSIDQPLHDIIPEAFDDDSRKWTITLYHALTMRTGLNFNNDDQTEFLFSQYTPDTLKYVLSRPLDHTPGTFFNYSDGDPQLVSGVIQKSAGKSLAEFAGDHLFGPLGIQDYLWERHGDGIVFGAFGLWLKPRDMAKIGQLCLQQGIWNGVQVVSASWLAESTRIHISGDGEVNYGLYWWVRPEFEGYAAIGHGGQYIYVIPGANLVIVMTAEPYTADVGITREEFEILVSRILDARTGG